MYRIITAFWIATSFLISQSLIGPGTTKTNLFNFLIANYKTSSTLGYNQARDKMYSIIDLEDNNTLKGIYTNYTIEIKYTSSYVPFYVFSRFKFPIKSNPVFNFRKFINVLTRYISLIII